MPRITDIYTIQTESQYVLTVEEKVNESQLLTSISSNFIKLTNYLNENHITPCETPYMQMKQEENHLLKIIIGVTIPFQIAGNDEIKCNTLKSGKKILCYFQGNNNDMNQVYDDMTNYAVDNSLEITDEIYEYYLNGIEYGEDKLLTRIVIAIN